MLSLNSNQATRRQAPRFSVGSISFFTSRTISGTMHFETLALSLVGKPAVLFRQPTREIRFKSISPASPRGFSSLKLSRTLLNVATDNQHTDLWIGLNDCCSILQGSAGWSP